MTPLPLKTGLVFLAMTATALLSGAAAESVGFAAAKQIIDSRGADPLAGIWRIGGGGATVAFLPSGTSASDFDIVLLDSPDLSVIPGQTIGHAAATGRIGTYDASLARTQPGNKKTVRCIITLGKDGRLSFDYYKQGYTVRLWRLIPYLFRFSVNRQDTRPSSVDGAVRIYPPTGQGDPVML